MPASTGITGVTPGAGHAAITTDLAQGLNIRPGAQIDVYAYGRPRTLTVDRIVPRIGVAGFSLSDQQEARNVLVSPATFGTLLRGGVQTGAPPVWMVAVSNRGGVESGAPLTDEVDRAIRHAASGLDPEVTPIKQQVLDAADQVGKGFTQMFTAMGSFGVLAGLLLLVNLFVMLAAERKSELGMARAVGMRRSALVGAFATEGFLYAFAASLLGTVVGIGLGRVLVSLSQSAFSSEHNRFDLYFTLKAASLGQAFMISFAVAILTIVTMSVRVSRLNIIRAIRDMPNRLVSGSAAGCSSELLPLSSVQSGRSLRCRRTSPLGCSLARRCYSPGSLRRSVASYPRTAFSVIAALVVVWGAVVFAVFPKSAEGASIMMYVAQGIVMTAGGVSLATLQLDRVGRGLRRFGGRALSLRLGLAYPLARPSRTGLTVSMYALVVFILTFITAISYMIDRQVTTPARMSPAVLRCT
jgi:ABC-type antimicrobial peptide transport system, permease component